MLPQVLSGEMRTGIIIFFNRVDHPFEACGWPLLVRRALVRQTLRNSTRRAAEYRTNALGRSQASTRSDGLENLSSDCQSSEPRAAQRAPPQPSFALAGFSTHRAPRVVLERMAINQPRKREHCC